MSPWEKWSKAQYLITTPPEYLLSNRVQCVLNVLKEKSRGCLLMISRPRLDCADCPWVLETTQVYWPLSDVPSTDLMSRVPFENTLWRVFDGMEESPLRQVTLEMGKPATGQRK
jgi:hypothetical protein